MSKQSTTNTKASQIVRLLEDLSIEDYTLYSNFYVGSPNFIEIRDVRGYFNLVKNLKIKSHRKYVGSPCSTDKLYFKYEGWIFETKVRRFGSDLQCIINELEKENLITNTES